jgi:hypothetical protein
LTLTSDPIQLVRDLNPVPKGSLRELAAERADELLTRLHAGVVSAPSIRRDHRWPRYLAVAVTAAVAVAVSVLATQSGTTHQVSPPSTTALPAGPPPMGPAPAGTPVASAAQADALLSFNVVLPSDATPQYMNVYKWDGRQQLQGYYDTASNGLYSVTEEPTTWSVTDLQQRANDWSTGSAQIVMVDGVHVLVGFDRITPGGETDVAWIRGNGASPVITWLVGPWIEGKSFTSQQALSVAADIIGQGG